MNDLLIDTKVVRNKSSIIREENEQFKSQIKELLTEINSLSSVWTTAAGTSFVSSANSNEATYMALVSKIEMFADLYEYAATKYEKTDSDAGEATSEFR